jgi:hypothetical protein
MGGTKLLSKHHLIIKLLLLPCARFGNGGLRANDVQLINEEQMKGISIFEQLIRGTVRANFSPIIPKF